MDYRNVTLEYLLLFPGIYGLNLAGTNFVPWFHVTSTFTLRHQNYIRRKKDRKLLQFCIYSTNINHFIRKGKERNSLLVCSDVSNIPPDTVWYPMTDSPSISHNLDKHSNKNENKTWKTNSHVSIKYINFILEFSF